MGIQDALDGLKDKAQDVLDKTDIDDKIVDAAKKAKDKAKDALDKTDLDEKIIDGAKKAKDKAGDLAQDAIDKVKDLAGK